MTKLRQKREEAGLAQWEVAQSLGVSQQHISRLETGRQRPSISLLWSLCKLFGADPQELGFRLGTPLVVEASP